MGSLNSKLREIFVQPNSMYAKPVARRIVLGLAIFFLLMIILSADFTLDRVFLEVGQISDRDIVSPKTVAYIDGAKTKKLELEVLASIENVYDHDVSVTKKTEERVTDIFRAAKVAVNDKNLTSAEQRQEKFQQLSEMALTPNLAAVLTSLDDQELAGAEEQAKGMLRKKLQRGIRDDELDKVKKSVTFEIEELGLSKTAAQAVNGVVQVLLQSNFRFNSPDTEKRKQAALANIEPVRQTIKKGQTIIRRGDVVTEEQINIIDELGLIKGHGSELRVLGLAVYVLMLMAITIGYLYKFAPTVYNSDLYLFLVGLILLVSLMLCKTAHYYSDFTAPVAVGALLVAILIDARVGLFVGLITSLLFGVVADGDLRVVLVALTGTAISVFSVSKRTHGYSLTKTGLWLALANFLIICASGFIEQVNAVQIVSQAMLGIAGGLITAVVTIGILPYLENTFNITTTMKLLGFAQPNHPLLQRLLLEAPGTYHHSVMLGNLAETAADFIGADAATVRVGAYYHDIGKIKRPYFFVENQVVNDNPHDKIAPSLSTLIITSHIKDGVDLCREYKLPQVIIDIVQQHHGTMLVSYFYNQATENEHSECIIEADFRYEGPCPQSKEAALIMLADACEAAVRAISRPNANRIEATVRKIIRERLHDGQLDECNLTLKDLNVIGDVFIRVLSSMFHKRVEYPEAVKELERRKNKNGNSNKQCAGKGDLELLPGTNSDVGVAKNG